MKNKKLILCKVVLCSMLMAVTAGCGQNAAESDVTGAYTNEDTEVIPEEAQAAFDKACETVTDREITLIKYRGCQIVAGTNYKFLANVDGTEMEIVVYKDLQGNCEFLDFE